jgi:hypothetical protein
MPCAIRLKPGEGAELRIKIRLARGEIRKKLPIEYMVFHVSINIVYSKKQYGGHQWVLIN